MIHKSKIAEILDLGHQQNFHPSKICMYTCSTVVWEKFTVGIFHVKKFHVKMFSSPWVKYAHILPYLFNGKNVSCVKFSS